MSKEIPLRTASRRMSSSLGSWSKGQLHNNLGIIVPEIKPFDPMAPVSLLIGAQLEEARLAVSEDTMMRRHCRKMALCAALSIGFWVIEFAQIAFATELNVPGQCDGNDLNLDSLFYAAPVYTAGALFCEVLYTLATVALLIYITRYYRLVIIARNRRRIATDQLKKRTKNPLFSSKFRYRYLFEMFICVLQPIPLLNLGKNYKPSLDDAIQPEYVLTLEGFALSQVSVGLVMFVRLYHMLRLFRDNTTVFKKRRDIEHFRASKGLRPIQFDWEYSLRTIYHKQYTKFCLLACFMSMFFFSMAFYVAEWNNPLQIRCSYNKPSNFNFEIAIYLTIITMTSVGYGDISPRSFLGRVVASLAAVTGMVLGALVVTTFMRWLELSRAETGVLHWVTDVKYRRKEREAAVVIIQAFWRAVKNYRSTRDPTAPKFSTFVNGFTSVGQQSHMQRALRRLTTKADYRHYLDFTAIDKRFHTLRKIQWMMTQKLGRIDTHEMDAPVKKSMKTVTKSADGREIVAHPMEKMLQTQFGMTPRGGGRLSARGGGGVGVLGRGDNSPDLSSEFSSPRFQSYKSNKSNPPQMDSNVISPDPEQALRIERLVASLDRRMARSEVCMQMIMEKLSADPKVALDDEEPLDRLQPLNAEARMRNVVAAAPERNFPPPVQVVQREEPESSLRVDFPQLDISSDVEFA